MAITGAHAIEQDYAHYVARAAKTVFAVVGTASKGPINEAVVCTSTQDLVNKFGEASPDHLGLYAAQYFLSKSSKCYFVRAEGVASTPATVTLAGKKSDGSTVKDAITLEFKEKGTKYNDSTVEISSTDGKYTITIKDSESKEIYKYNEITLLDIILLDDEYLKVSETRTPDTTITSLESSTYTAEGGVDSVGSADYIKAANTLLADTVDMNIFAVPGQSDHELITTMLGIAEAKGDCLYLVDPPKDLESNIEGDISTRDAIIAWREKLSKDIESETKYSSSYGSLYYDWVNIYDSVNRVEVLVPPSVVVAATIAHSDSISEVWYAPAGLKRGIVNGVLSTRTKLNKTDVDYLYEKGINSIYEDPQVGLVVWGQKTLLTSDTALNRINVRRLMNYLKRVIVAACNYLTFDPNDRITWNSFMLKVDPVLRDIKKKRGIYEYRIVGGTSIVTDDDIDNYRMPCKILIQPTKAAEEIPIYFSITSTGADFNSVLDSSNTSN